MLYDCRRMTPNLLLSSNDSLLSTAYCALSFKRGLSSPLDGLERNNDESMSATDGQETSLSPYLRVASQLQLSGSESDIKRYLFTMSALSIEVNKLKVNKR